MKNYIVIYHAPAELMVPSEKTTPEDMKESMKAWMEWAENCGDQLVDMGTPLMGGQKVLPGGGSENSLRQVCGYSILSAESMDEAKSLIEGHPHLDWNAACEIEIHEAMPLPGSN